MARSAHVDTFVRDRLPPPEQWPERIYELPELQFPERMNCAGELIDRAVAEYGWAGRSAILSPRGNMSYAQLQEAANRVARVLVEDLGVVPGNRVLLRGGNSPVLAACWLAVQKVGAIAVTTMPLLRPKELIDVICKAQISHALCDLALADDLAIAAASCPVLCHIVHFHADADPTGLEARARAKPATFANVDTAADDIALIAFTSGTTGGPKGTLHSHRDVMSICACFPRSMLRPGDDEIFCGSPSLAFTFGLGGLLLFPLACGGAAVLAEKLTPEGLLETIARYRATICFSGPTFYRMMAGSVAKFDIASLRQCVSAGEALPVATRRLWQEASGIRIIDGIGSTELLHIFISAAGDDIREGATGRPIPGYRATLFDSDGKPVAPGAIGRLAVKGPTGCRYLDDERQNDYVKDGWNFTGDAYVMDADGYFFYQSRTDDLIISAGYNIAGPEVEDVLLTHPAVAECGVVGVPDEGRGQVVKACVVLRSGFTAGPELAGELQDYVKQHIAPYKYPRQIEFRDALPRTETGKLQRFKLREKAIS